MSGFSFNTTAGASQSTAKPRLVGNEIYKVKFDGVEIKDIVGVKDPSMTYKTMVFKFSNEDGYYNDTVFEPRGKDFERQTTEYTNKEGKVEKILQPSGLESVMLYFKHVIDVINPKVAKAIDEGTQSLGAKDWDGIRTLVEKIVTPGIGTETSIKLLINNKGEATFPGFYTGLTKEGKAYIKNNFIGDKITFSTYEVGRIAKTNAATPTSMPSFTPPAAGVAESGVADASGLDLDFDVVNL